MTKQYQSEAINELAAALAKAQAEMQHAGKTAENPFFKSKYADLPAVIDAARPFLAKNGLAVTQPIDIDESGNLTLVTQLSHASGQWMRSWYPVRPVKNDPQGLGSAVTYARRYSYCSLVGVAADDDDDGNAASGNTNGNGHAQPAPPAAPAYRPHDPVRPQKDAYVVACPIKPDGTLDFDSFTAELETAINGATNVNEVSMYNRSNSKTLKAMQTERPDLFAAIGEKFREMSNALK